MPSVRGRTAIGTMHPHQRRTVRLPRICRRGRRASCPVSCRPVSCPVSCPLSCPLSSPRCRCCAALPGGLPFTDRSQITGTFLRTAPARRLPTARGLSRRASGCSSRSCSTRRSGCNGCRCVSFSVSYTACMPVAHSVHTVPCLHGGRMASQHAF